MVRDPLTGGRTAAGQPRRGFSLRFISEAYRELQRVTWPTREETMRLTLMVIAVAAAVITVPPLDSPPIIDAALNAGVHVLTEKPASVSDTTPRTSRSMASLSRRSRKCWR